jgi:hypothetical protein
MFIAISSIIITVTVKQHDTHWNMTLRRVQSVDFNMLHATLPYTLAFLEQQKRRDLIQQVVDSNFGLFGIAYMDNSGKIIAKSSRPRKNVSFSKDTLNGNEFSYVFSTAQARQVVVPSIYSGDLVRTRPTRPEGQEQIGRVYLIRSKSPTFTETFFGSENWRRLLITRQPSDYFVNILWNFSAIGVLGFICIWAARLQGKVEQARMAAHEAELENLRGAISLAELKLRQSQDALHRASSETTQMGEQMRLANVTTTALQNENEALTLEWEKADGEMRRVQYRCQELEREVSGRQSGWEKSKQELAKQDVLRKRLEQEVNERKIHLEEIESARQEAEKRRELLEAEVTEHQSEIERLKKELNVAALPRKENPETLKVQQMLEAVWPHLEVTPTAARQLLKECRKSSPSLGRVCHLMAIVETGSGRLDNLAEHGVEVKKWKVGTGFWELKKPPFRVIIRRDGSRSRVEYIVFNKDSTSEQEITHYIETHS